MGMIRESTVHMRLDGFASLFGELQNELYRSISARMAFRNERRISASDIGDGAPSGNVSRSKVGRWHAL